MRKTVLCTRRFRMLTRRKSRHFWIVQILSSPGRKKPWHTHKKAMPGSRKFGNSSSNTSKRRRKASSSFKSIKSDCWLRSSSSTRTIRPKLLTSEARLKNLKAVLTDVCKNTKNSCRSSRRTMRPLKPLKRPTQRSLHPTCKSITRSTTNYWPRSLTRRMP